MKRTWTAQVMVAGALLASGGTNAETGDPLQVAGKVFDAAQAWRCEEVWRSLSTGTQENLRAAAHRYERERDGPPATDPPEKQHCLFTPGKMKRETLRIVRQDGNEAVVAMDFAVRRPRHEFDVFAPTTITVSELRLVRESGAWRVERPRLPIGRKGWQLVEVGTVDVFHEAKPPRGFHRKLEATAVSRVSRSALDAALRDPVLWARALPSVREAQPLEGERVRLVFGSEPERSLIVATRRSQDARQWEAEGGNKAPVYLRGSWTLAPHHDGTRVTLQLVIDERQWPGDVVEGIFSAQGMARAMLDLDRSEPR